LKKNTLYLIGNGPSLNYIDLPKLRNHRTISFNRAFIAYGDWGFFPTFYMIIDMRVLRSEISNVNALIKSRVINQLFIRDENLVEPASPDWRSADHIAYSDNVTMFRTKSGPGIGKTWQDLFYCGDVGACAIQIVRLKGFDRVILLGVDQNWSETVPDVDKNGDLWTSKEDSDPNHFRPDYYGKGTQYSNPYGESHFQSWLKVIAQAQQTGPEIISASPNSRLNGHIEYRPELAPFLDVKKELQKEPI